MRPLTILQITSSHNRSGGTRQAMLLSAALRDRGHRVVFCAPEGSAALAWAAGAGFQIHGIRTGSLLTQWRMSRRVRELARQAGADVVHAHHTEGHNVALLATFGGGLPPMVANRGVLFRPEFPAKFRSRRTAAVITNSGTVKRVLETCGVPPAKVHVVYNAKEPPGPETARARLAPLRRELDTGGGGPVIGAAGSARPEKGFQFLVEAAPQILDRIPRAIFVLVGRGTERLLPRLRELGVESRFRLPGYRDDAVEVMGLFDVFVIPSIGMESCPNVLLEAMGMSLPVVGADTGGIPEIVADGVTGTVVPPGDAAALAEAVTDILGDPGKAREMGRSGLERLLAEFSVEQKVRRTLDVYREVLAS